MKKWFINAPTLKNEENLFLSTDPEDKQPRLVLAAERGPHTEWNFDFVKHDEAYAPKEGKGFRDGTATSTFKLQAANGPFQGYYVGADALSEADRDQASEEPVRALKLVKERQDAIDFDYIDARYWVVHK